MQKGKATETKEKDKLENIGKPKCFKEVGLGHEDLLEEKVKI